VRVPHFVALMRIPAALPAVATCSSPVASSEKFDILSWYGSTPFFLAYHTYNASVKARSAFLRLKGNSAST
jgi:hypothetical protein